ncbi:4663_t:CDS:2, partial [Entrophospora sp. SA101]
MELAKVSEMPIQQPEISNQIEKDVPLDQHTEFLPASFVEELLMELKNYS